jgi:hypothetical protein
MVLPIIRAGMAIAKKGVKKYKDKKRKKEDEKLIKEFGARDAKEARQLKKLDDEAREEARREMATPEYKRQRRRDLDATILRTYRKSKEFPEGAKNLKEAKEMDRQVERALRRRGPTYSAIPPSPMKKGGKVKSKVKKMRAGGPVGNGKKKADGIAIRGKTRCKMR